ncbi:HlyD family secretion protein [Nitrosomonas sp. Nm51]|uniref:efflux RND transporter periplasmic adaptor subunit n=1 Tax=Nitrosomonas sp. Nm51 TaxID=133720 RepID=UPI0008D1D143|nr:efflux RND transporter periplasmic adaptor subunit [Nitrosomonas sp. Nm51]SER13340.1 HlyD family secretion protein [Nitrosomonas sp. Nm51]
MPQSRKIFRLTAYGGSIALILSAVWYFTRPQPPEAEFAAVTYGSVEATVVNTRAGTVKACQRAKLAPALGGQIARILVEEGDSVEQDQVLLELWNADLIAQRELAERQLAMAQERHREACILAENAWRESQRTQQLVDKGFISPQAAEDADANARARQASCDAALSDIKRAKAQIRVTQAGLERTVLKAPFAGIVAKITGEIGEYATPSPPGIAMPPVIDLIDTSCLYVTAPMDEIDAPRIKLGQPARITLDAMPEISFSGLVSRIAPYVTEVEKQARTVDIEVNFTDFPDNPLLAGYSADVEVILDSREHVLRIPTQALRQNNQVWLLGPDNTLIARQLETGLANWSFTEVVNGIKDGDRVLISFDLDEIKPGIAVRPKQPKEPDTPLYYD